MIIKKIGFILIIPIIYFLSEWLAQTKEYEFCNRFNEWLFYAKSFKSETHFFNNTGLKPDNILHPDSVIVYADGTAVKKYFYEYNSAGNLTNIKHLCLKNNTLTKNIIDISGKLFYDDKDSIKTSIDTLNLGGFKSIATSLYNKGKVCSVEYESIDGDVPTKHSISYDKNGNCILLKAYSNINGRSFLCQRNSFEYDQNGCLICAEYKSITDKNNHHKYTYEYNEKSYLVRTVNYFRDWHNKWMRINEFVREYEYDEHNRIRHFTDYRIDNGSKKIVRKTINKYDHNGNQIEKEEYEWNSKTKRLERKNRYTRFFNLKNQLIREDFARKTKTGDEWHYYSYAIYYPKKTEQ
ncbi:MAG: hypothetical protein LBV72_05865 [Tannerella sp.]|jgi:hypothetical protein|nr:hypothetical protein [Tannerella sp.]